MPAVRKSIGPAAFHKAQEAKRSVDEGGAYAVLCRVRERMAIAKRDSFTVRTKRKGPMRFVLWDAWNAMLEAAGMAD